MVKAEMSKYGPWVYRYIDSSHIAIILADLSNSNIIRSVILFAPTDEKSVGNHAQCKRHLISCKKSNDDNSDVFYFLTNDERRRILQVLRSQDELKNSQRL